MRAPAAGNALRLCGLLLGAALAIGLAPRSLSADEGATAEPAPAVDEAGRALGRWFRFPWYDRNRDDLAPVDYRQRSYDPPDLSILRILGWIVLAALLAGLAWALVSAWINRSSTPGPEQAPRGVSASLEHVEALPFLAARSTHDLLGQAQRHFAEGNFAEAIVFLFSYQLIELDRHNLIRLAKGKTNRQYLRELRSRPALDELLAPTMVAFEDVYFGGVALDRERFEACWNRLPRFEALLTQAPDLSAPIGGRSIVDLA